MAGYYNDLSNHIIYTEYAGWAVTLGTPVKFGTAHRRSRPEFARTKCIDVYGSGVILWPYLICGTYNQKSIPSMMFLRPKLNFVSLTVCTFMQYLQSGIENKIMLPYTPVQIRINNFCSQ